MEIDKALQLDAAPAQVWALLLDPQAMGACVPGMQSIDVISPDEYAAQMHVKISFISARFKLRTRIVERREPHYLKAEGTGEDASVASSLKQTTEMVLEPRPDGGTDLRLKVKVDLLGRMGTFGLSVMKTKADRMWDEFGLNLAARLAEGAATAAVIEVPVLVAPATAAPAGPASQPAGPQLPAEHLARPPSSAGAAATVGPLTPPTLPAAVPAREAPPGWWPSLLRAIGIQPAGSARATGTIVVEVRRPDQTVFRIEWPAAQSGECAQWLRDAVR